MMITIAEAISDLLYVRDTVVVPGLGAFVKKPVSAKVNPVANYFARPSSVIEFDANLREDNDLVINYLSEKNEIPMDEARRLLVMFVSDCFNSMKAGKKVVLKDVGALYYDWAEDLAFEPDKAVNYNSDAFGLTDLTPEPILRSKTKDEIKAEIAKQQRDKNTPVTVDEKAVHEDDELPERHFGWLWILLGLLLLALVGLGLHYFRVVDFGRLLGKKVVRGKYEPKTYTLPSYVKTWEWKEAAPAPTDTVAEPAAAEPAVTEPVVAEPAVTEPAAAQTQSAATPAPADANIRIIAGCFVQEEYAANMVKTLKSEGYRNAFYEPRGKRWFVAVDRYRTMEEATAALLDIRANSDYEVWILNK